MRKSGLIRLVAGTVAGVCLGGCVETTSVKDSPRAAVQFESASAAKTFYDAYVGKYYGVYGNASFAVAVPLPYSHKDLNTDNVNFDEAVRAADANHDGTISEAESSAYAASVARSTGREAPAVAAKAP